MGLLWSGPSNCGSIVLPPGERAWIICHFGLRAALKVGDNPRSIMPWKPDCDLCNSARGTLSKVDIVGVLYYTKVLPREMSPQYPKPPSFISKLNKTAGHSYIDTPGTVYLEVFVDSHQGCIVLSFSFAGGGGPKDQRTCGYLNDWEFARVVNGDGL